MNSWSRPDDASENASRRDFLGCAALAALLTCVVFVVLQILLIAVALGTANYDRGTPGPAGGLGFGLMTAAAVGVACAAGAWAGSRSLRRRDGTAGQSLLVGAAGAGAPIAALVLLNVVVAAPRLVAVLFTVLAVAVGSIAGGRWGAAADAGRQ